MNDIKYFFSTDFFHSFPPVNFVWELLHWIPHYLQQQKLGEIKISLPIGVYLENPHLISIEEGTIVESGSYIKGPVKIGKNCQIRQGAYIRENVILEEGAVVGHATEVKNSIFLAKAHAAHFNYVGDSILGENTNLGAGVKCANFKLDHGEVKVLFEGKRIATGLQKLGLILGDGSQIGCNAVTSPGTLMGKGVLCNPCKYTSGFIPSHSRVK